MMTDRSSHFVACQWSLKVCCPSSNSILSLCLNANKHPTHQENCHPELSNQPSTSSFPPVTAVSRLTLTPTHFLLCHAPPHPSHIRRSKTNLSTPQVEPEAGTFPPYYLPWHCRYKVTQIRGSSLP